MSLIGAPMQSIPTTFDAQNIRRVYDEEADIWWFSVIDIVKEIGRAHV